MIPPTINTHIDCSKNSKSLFGAFTKQQQGALKVCWASFSVRLPLEDSLQETNFCTFMLSSASEIPYLRDPESTEDASTPSTDPTADPPPDPLTEI